MARHPDTPDSHDGSPNDGTATGAAKPASRGRKRGQTGAAAIRLAAASAKMVTMAGAGGGDGIAVDPVLLDPRAPWDIAHAYVEAACERPDGTTLRYWRGSWWKWDASGWRMVEEQDLRNRLYPWLALAKQAEPPRRRAGSQDKPKPLNPNARMIGNVLDALSRTPTWRLTPTPSRRSG